MISTQSVLQHIPGVPGGMGHWGHLGAFCLVNVSTALHTSSTVHLLRPSGPGLAATQNLSVQPKAFWGEQMIASDQGRHVLLLAGTQVEDQLSADFELVLADIVTGQVMRHSVAFKPAWFSWHLDDSVVLAADATGQNLLTLDFR